MTTATMRVPDRTTAQRLEALANANRIRSRRAQLKRDVKACREDPVELVMRPPAFADAMHVRDLLLAVPKLGHVKVDKALRIAGVSPAKTLAGLSGRQRQELARLLAGRRPA